VGFRAYDHSGHEPRFSGGGIAVYLCAVFQPGPQSFRHLQSGLFCGQHRCTHRLPLGGGPRAGQGAAGLLGARSEIGYSKFKGWPVETGICF